MSITKFNKGQVLFTDNERLEDFKTLEELFINHGKEQEYPVKGVYNYKSSYGEGCFIKSDGFNISLPNHLLDTIKIIREDVESVQAINEGKISITIYSYTLPDKYPDKVFYSVNFEE